MWGPTLLEVVNSGIYGFYILCFEMRGLGGQELEPGGKHRILLIC